MSNQKHNAKEMADRQTEKKMSGSSAKNKKNNAGQKPINGKKTIKNNKKVSVAKETSQQTKPKNNKKGVPIEQVMGEAVARKSHIPFRLNFLFFIVFMLFVFLIIGLAKLQIVDKDFFASKIEWSQKNIVQEAAPRGEIFDAKGRPLVKNKAQQAIVFTKKAGMKAEETLEISRNLTELITVPDEELSERDKKDYWLANPTNLKQAQARLKAKEKVDKNGNELSPAEQYRKLVDKVTPTEATLAEQDKQAAIVFKKINGAYALDTVFIKNKGVTPEEIAIVGEHVAELPGVSASMDWEREYPQGEELRSILGTVSSEKTGLPEEEIDNYLAMGYSRNDRVGLSYLEKSYEPVLRGTKSQSEVIINKKNKEVVSQRKVYDGEKGKNLMLTIDLDFQKKIENILRSNYQILIQNGKARYSEGAYIVVNQPKTGEIYALVGLQHDTYTGELTEDVLGTFTSAFVPGSSIKAATIMAGYQNGVIHGNETMIDEPIQIGGSSRKISLFNPIGKVPVNTTTALALSSNVYMMKIAMKMMDVDYKYGMNLPARTDVYDTLRNTYQNFGLGTNTGLDLPGESLGLSPKDHYDGKGNLKAGRMGNLLDLSFGNYDTYTPVQLAQYISTVANDGKRVAPHVVRGIYGTSDDGGLGDVDEMVGPTVLSQIGKKEELDIIQQGLYEVVNGSDYRRTGMALQGGKYVVSAKTGTAETFVPNPMDKKHPFEVVNSTLVGYAPSENPEVAVTVVLPHIEDDKDHMNLSIAKQVFDAYYDVSH